ARLFSIRSAPMSDSRRRIWALTAGWVSSNRWAALVKLPSSQMATKVRSRSVGMLVIPVGEISLPASVSITSPLRWRPLAIRIPPCAGARSQFGCNLRREPPWALHRGFSSLPLTRQTSYRNLRGENTKFTPVLAHSSSRSFSDDFDLKSAASLDLRGLLEVLAQLGGRGLGRSL